MGQLDFGSQRTETCSKSPNRTQKASKKLTPDLSVNRHWKATVHPGEDPGLEVSRGLDNDPQRYHILMEPGTTTSSGCHNKTPHTGWLQQQKVISHSSRGRGVHGQGAGEFVLGEGSLSAGRQMPALSSLPPAFFRENPLSLFLRPPIPSD